MTNGASKRLAAVPQLGTAIDLAERKAMAEPAEIITLVVPLPSGEGRLMQDKRLPPGQLVQTPDGVVLVWVLPVVNTGPNGEQVNLNEIDPPLIKPYFV